MVQSKLDLWRACRVLLTETDLGVLPRLLHHHLSPRLRNLLPNHPCQELELHSPHRGHRYPILPVWGTSSQQDRQQGIVPQEQELETPLPAHTHAQAVSRPMK